MTQSNLVRAFVLANSLWAMAAFGQSVPTTVAFTGNLAGSGGPATGNHNFVFKLFDAATGGANPWTETQNALTVNNGIVYATLGSSTAFTPGLLNGSPLFLEVTVDSVVLTPRIVIQSVPYAVRAGVANQLGTLNPGDVQRRVAGTCTGLNAVQTIDAAGNVTCVAITQGDITGVITAGGSGLTGGVASGDATLSVDGTVQRRGAAPNDLTCAAGRYINSINGAGLPVCATDLDTGVNAVTSGAGIAASIASRNLTITNTGVLSISSANAFITSSTSSGGAATITANVGSVANTLAAGDHGHNMGCGFRSVNATSATLATAACNANEVLTGGGCNTNGTLVDTNPFQSCPPLLFCLCLAGNRCAADSWRCATTAAASITAYAMCCDRPIRGNIP